MQFDVFGKKIKIIKVKKLMEQKLACGIYNPRHKTIEVDTALKGDDLLHTYLHEIIHATVDRLGLHNAQLSHDLEEILAENIPMVLIENFNIKVKCKKRVE